jgi:3-oxoacyl-[acyl-carrier protein] reductase
MAGRLEDRVAIVTGGGHGIGKFYCRGLAGEGARVVIAELDERAANQTADELLSDGFEALPIRTDVADEASARGMAEQAMERYGRIDVLVNNAAIFATIPISRVPIEEISVEEWDAVMAVNLRGVFLASRAVLPAMKQQRRGKIINIASGTVFSGSPTRIHYVTSKAGVVGFTRVLARELGEYGINVNCIAPGSTLSEAEPTEEILAMRQAGIHARAFQRVQLPADLVGAVLFFASDDSAFVTGQTLLVDGGNNMH